MIRLVAQLVVILAAALACLVRIPAAWVERLYSRGLYALVQPRLTALSNAVPFALFDVLVLTTALLVARAAVRVACRPGRALAVARLLIALGTWTAAAYLVFFAVWGLNYQRQPITTHLRFDAAAARPQAVAALGAEAVRQLNRLRDEAHRQGFPEWRAMPAVMGPAFQATVAHLAPGLRPNPGLPKWSLLSFYFRYAGISGMTDPFTLEILVDRSQLPFERAFVTAHEWAHLAGYADEAEANFVGWLTCMRGRAPEAYSGWIFALFETLHALPRDERATLVRSLAPGPRADLAAITARAQRIQPILQSFSWRIYDQYLKANRVEHGVRSYGRVLVLMLGTRFADGWIPVTVGN
jgi:hypothetical protein